MHPRNISTYPCYQERSSLNEYRIPTDVCLVQSVLGLHRLMRKKGGSYLRSGLVVR